MCNFKSGIILKDRVYIPDHDNHSAMLEELNIVDDSPFPDFVKIELRPDNGDVFTPIDTWDFVVDQDRLPDWFVQEVDEAKFRESAKVWASKHVFIGVDNLNIQAKNKEVFYLKDCKNAIVRAWDSATVRASGSATVEAWGNATVEASGSATVRASDSATVRAWGSATVRAWGSATVIIPCGSYNKRENIVLSQDSTLKDCNSKTIYQSGNWKVELVTVEGE